MPAVPATPAQSGRGLDDILSRYAAAADARRALHEAGSYRPTQDQAALADRLEHAAEAIQPTHRASRPSSRQNSLDGMGSALRCQAHLMRWDIVVQDASDNADRHLLAARRRAEVTLAGMPADHASGPSCSRWPRSAPGSRRYSIPGDTAGLASEVASIPLPVRIIEEHSRRYHPPALSGEDEQRPVPAVGICRLDGAIVTNAYVLRPDEIHDFGLELRLAIAALQACGALSPLSPVPGQLAALCASLDVTGHGITARPARQLPGPWLSMLAHHRRRKLAQAPGRDGCAAAAVAFPELDGIRLAILGLHNVDGSTVLYGHAGSMTLGGLGGPPDVESDFPLRIWIRDCAGRWHATRVTRRGWSAEDDSEMTMRLEVVPALSPATDWIEMLAAGQSAQARATLPLRWH